MMNRIYCILTFLLLSTRLLLAQTFTASVSKSEVAIGEQFELTFATNGNGDSFTPPNFNGFQILSGPNISQSVTSINGSTTVQNAYSYVLIAAREGILTIGSASMVVNGHRLSTNIIKILVVRGRQLPRNNGAQNGNGQQIQPVPGEDISKSIFIRAVVDKNSLYQGDHLTVTYRLYTRLNIEQSAPDKLPDLNGFWSQDIKTMQQQAQWHDEVYKGRPYKVTDLKQTILFPQHAGNITIDPLSMTFIVQQPVQSNDPMDQFFGNNIREVKYTAKSLPVIINAKPLPLAGRPASFTGAVGNFRINTSVDKKELKANESLNYKVEVSGSGNLKLLKTVNTVFPADFEKYDPKITDSTVNTTGGVAGAMIYNYLLIPRHQGDYTIDPLQFSYFNPATGKYVTISAKGFKIKVDKGVIEKNVSALTDQQDVKTLGKDIRYIKTDYAALRKSGDDFFGSIEYYLLLLIGPVACLAAFQYHNYLIKRNSDVVQVKSRRAGREAAKHLANAQKQLQAANTQAFYEDVFKGLYGYLSDKLNLPYASLDRETISSALKVRSVNQQLVNRLLETLDLCEMARYAPVAHISIQQVFNQAQGIINEIESVVK